MNLKKMNLVELDAQEVKSVEGGIWPIILVVALCSGCAATRGPSQNFQGNGQKPKNEGGGGGW